LNKFLRYPFVSLVFIAKKICMKTYWILLLLVGCYTTSSAQFTRYIIKLKDKTGSPFSISNPSAFLSARSIERRVRYNIPFSESDLPLNYDYLNTIAAIPGVTFLNSSKWFNQVCIKTTDLTAIGKINALPFVLVSMAVAPRPLGEIITKNKQFTIPKTTLKPVPVAKPNNPADFYHYGLSYNQVHLHNAEFLHNVGFHGEGMQLAIMDAGFQNYLTLPTFDSVRNNNQIMDTWDFVTSKKNVNGDHPHGMNCFSTIAANMPGSFVGTAPKGSFFLYRTEDATSEYPIEEHFFAAAAERADSIGVDVFTVSLGYNSFDNSAFNYSYADLNGNTTLIARAADMAAQKGIAVIVAAGNEGSSNWRYITTPADADSVFTVGAVSNTRQPGNFSSFGPSSDGQIKPDVAAIGVNAVIANVSNGQPMYSNGTSFANPIMAGIVTCLWQAFPGFNNMTIFDAIRKSSDRANNPDDRTGYGIPDAKKAFVLLQKKKFTQQFEINNKCTTNITWSVRIAKGMNTVLERKLPTDNAFVAIDTQTVNTIFSKQNFSYSDQLQDIEMGTAINYRIKMMIGADTSFYLDSAIIIANQSCKINNKNYAVSPNPVIDNALLKIKLESAAKLDFLVQNTLGQQLYHSNKTTVAGQQTFIIPMKQFTAGTYLITVLVNGKKLLAVPVIKM